MILKLQLFVYDNQNYNIENTINENGDGVVDNDNEVIDYY